MSYRLLVVDDDDAARTSLQSLINATLPDAVVDVASNAAEGMAHIERHDAYHVVVTDMRMPEGTEGLSVVMAAREKERTSEIIVLTAYGDMGNVYQALEVGANQYIDKNLPETVTVQISAIRNAAERAATSRRTARRLQAMERLAKEIERSETAFNDVVQALHLLVDYARAITTEEEPETAAART